MVTNRSGQPIEFMGCGTPFNVILRNEHIEQETNWPMCGQKITIPTGESKYDVAMIGTYTTCNSDPFSSTQPRCIDGSRLPPLPPGDYDAVLQQIEAVVPAPPPISIHVLK